MRAKLVRCALGWLALLGAGCSKCGPSADLEVPRDAAPSPGAGCSSGVPSGFPYQPGCCSYAVGVPAGLAAGFSSHELGPKPAPLDVHLGWGGAPESTMAVSWRTDAATMVSEVLFGTDAQAVGAADGPGGGVKLATGHHLLLEGSLLGGSDDERIHEVHLCGLASATAYAYRVGGPGAWSEVRRFTTAPAAGTGARFKLAVLGDSRDGPDTWARLEQAVARQGVSFQLYGGDAVLSGADLRQWTEFFQASVADFRVEQLLGTTPTLMVNGNHEGLAAPFVAQFVVPEEVTPGEQAAGKEWYSFDYGNAHVVGLNDWPRATALGRPERDWLAADLARVDRSKAPWLFVFHHTPLYSCGKHGSNLELRAAWQPLFDQYRVDLVFAGHDHIYERSKPIRGLDGKEGKLAAAGPNGAPIGESGTIYVVTAGAGAPLYPVHDNCAHTERIESVHHYVLVEVDGRTLRYSALRLDGSVLDQVELSK